MKIDVCVPATWVETTISWEDISYAIQASIGESDGKDSESVIRLIARCHEILRGIPDEFIARSMSDKQREIVAGALAKQANRFKVEP